MISLTEGRILQALANGEPRHGYEIAETEGLNLKAIYKTLRGMERKLLLQSANDGEGRVLYTVTPAGKAMAGVLIQTGIVPPVVPVVKAALPPLADEHVHDLRVA